MASSRPEERRSLKKNKKTPSLSPSRTSDAVQALLDDGRDRLDLRPELLLDPIEVEPVVVGDEVDRQAQVAKAPRAADAVQVRLRRLGEVEVDDDVDGLDIDAAREQVGGDEVAAGPVAEVVEDTVAVRLQHARVDVEARVAELGDLLGEELDAVDRVAEDDGLVDLELGEQGVEAMHLRVVGFFFLKESLEVEVERKRRRQGDVLEVEKKRRPVETFLPFASPRRRRSTA